MVEGLLLLIVCVSYRCYHKKRVRLKLDTWILIPPMDEMVNDNGHGQKVCNVPFCVMLSFLTCSKRKRGGEGRVVCYYVNHRRARHNYYRFYEGEEWSKNQRRQGWWWWSSN